MPCSVGLVCGDDPCCAKKIDNPPGGAAWRGGLRPAALSPVDSKGLGLLIAFRAEIFHVLILAY